MALNKTRKPQYAYSYVKASSWLLDGNPCERSPVGKSNVAVMVMWPTGHSQGHLAKALSDVILWYKIWHWIS